ncbi:MAG TPA: hypothetical protein ENH99_01660 [Candidatus Pacearchaeota archaeon]|nr:hypothetical protein [Candidatus Pacearchaeota archaeon]
MDEITQKQFDKATALQPEKIEKETKEIAEVDFKILLDEMQNPVLAQQHVAVKIKIFLDKRMDKEMEEKGYLTDHTRRWVESYNNILEKIQKALHGDKSVNLHLHAISHSQIATKMREAIKHQNDTIN